MVSSGGFFSSPLILTQSNQQFGEALLYRHKGKHIKNNDEGMYDWQVDQVIIIVIIISVISNKTLKDVRHMKIIMINNEWEMKKVVLEMQSV